MEKIERCSKCGDDHTDSQRCRKLSRNERRLLKKSSEESRTPVDFRPEKVGGYSDVIFMPKDIETNRQAHERMAGYPLSDKFFTKHNIDHGVVFNEYREGGPPKYSLKDATFCPYCGEHPEYEVTKQYYPNDTLDMFFVECSNTLCPIKPRTSWYDTLQKALIAWNTRASDIVNPISLKDKNTTCHQPTTSTLDDSNPPTEDSASWNAECDPIKDINDMADDYK